MILWQDLIEESTFLERKTLSVSALIFIMMIGLWASCDIPIVVPSNICQLLITGFRKIFFSQSQYYLVIVKIPQGRSIYEGGIVTISLQRQGNVALTCYLKCLLGRVLVLVRHPWLIFPVWSWDTFSSTAYLCFSLKALLLMDNVKPGSTATSCTLLVWW